MSSYATRLIQYHFLIEIIYAIELWQISSYYVTKRTQAHILIKDKTEAVMTSYQGVMKSWRESLSFLLVTWGFL